jgi:hypothetical protein
MVLQAVASWSYIAMVIALRASGRSNTTAATLPHFVKRTTPLLTAGMLRRLAAPPLCLGRYRARPEFRRYALQEEAAADEAAAV